MWGFSGDVRASEGTLRAHFLNMGLSENVGLIFPMK